MKTRYSLVIPVHNEAENIVPVAGGAVEVLESMEAPYEVIFVNDGSTDETAGRIAEAAARWPVCRELRLARRMGQARALYAGLGAASGSVILTMDGDGQNDPRDFPALLALVESAGADLACGWRQGRHEALWRRLLSRAANRVRRMVLKDGVHDAGCQLRAMRAGVRDALEPVELMQAFVPALACAAGLRVMEAPVRDNPRLHGSSKYGLALFSWGPVSSLLRLRRARRRP